MIWLVLLACGPGFLGNSPPELVSVNGVPIDELRAIPVQRGDDLKLHLEIHDPEGHHVRVWWPLAPAGFAWDPDQHHGTWHGADPWKADPAFGRLILEDTHPRDPAFAEYHIYFGDTGDYYEDTGHFPEP